jgi:hypothetical protein
MRTPRIAARSFAPEDLPNALPCNAQAEAIDRQTAAIERLTDEVVATRKAFKPAADSIHSLGEAQQKLCNFLVNNRLKIVAGLLAGLVAVGAISPNVATALGAILKAMGAS